ncbi:hypothetical protein M5D96_012114, partial [Drosophila gunungcola]
MFSRTSIQGICQLGRQGREADCVVMTGLQWTPPQFPKRARIPVYVGVILCQRSSSNALWYFEQNLL